MPKKKKIFLDKRILFDIFRQEYALLVIKLADSETLYAPPVSIGSGGFYFWRI